MALRPVSHASNYKVSFILKRSAEDSASEIVWVNLRLCFFVNHYDIEEKEEDCKFPLSKGKKFTKLLEQLSKLKFMYCDLLKVTCKMIVYNKKPSPRFGKCDDVGISLLSEDLFNLYKHGHNYDILLRVGKKYILAHKALLSARNETFRYMIENDSEDLVEYSILRLPRSFSFKGLRKVLAFLYSGNLKHVLREPSHGILDWVMYLDIEAIFAYYIRDKLILRSCVDVELFTFTLHFSDTKSSFEEHEIKLSKHISDSIYELLVHNKINETDVSFCFKSPEKNRFKRACLEIFADRTGRLKSVGTFLYSIRDIMDKNDCKICEESLIGNYKTNNRIVIKLRLSCMVQNSFVENQRSIFKNCLDQDTCYDYLSADLLDLYSIDFNYADAILFSNTGVSFLVHRFILESRSDFLKNAFQESDEDIVLNMDGPVLGMVLSYLYSGSFSDDFVNQEEKLPDVYKAAAEINLPILKEMCSEALKVCFETNINIRCRAMKIAEDYKDVALKEHFLNHLFASVIQIPFISDIPIFRDVQACEMCA